MTILGPGFERMPGEACDSGFSSVVLEHGFRWLIGQEPSYLDAPFLYPFQKAITLSDNFLSTLPIYSIFRLAGADREEAYQFWFLSLFILNFLCARWALVRLKHPPGLAALGAYLFAFLAPVLEEVTHPALLHLFPLPLAVCGFILWAETGSTRAFAGMCAAVVLQFYGAFYLGSFLVLALFLLGVAWLSTHRGIAGFGRADGDAKISNLFVAGCWLAIATLALLPLVLPYLETSQANGLRRFWIDVAPQLPTLPDLFRASPGNLLWGWTSDPSQVRSFNNVMHLGLLPWLGMAACVIALIRKRLDKRIAAVLLTVFLLAVLTLRVGDFSLFKYVQWLPAFQSMRALTRVVLVESFLVILAFLWALQYALAWIRTDRLRNAAFGCICLLAVLDQGNILLDHYGYDKVERRMETAEVREEMRAAIALAGLAGQAGRTSQGGPLAYLPAPQDAQGNCRITVAAMLAAQDLHRPVVNAYSSWFPRGYGFYWDTGCRELRRWMLRSQAASENALFSGLVLAGPGSPPPSPASVVAENGPAPREACLPVPAGREAARAELLEDFAQSGEKDALAWAIDASGFSRQGNNELWMGRTGALTLRAGESLTLEGVSFVPLDVRISVDGKSSGKMSFSGLPTRMTLAPSKTTRYEFTADKAFTSYGGAFSPAFPEVSVIFTSVRFQPAQP
ncbi:MAG: hypothetical protein ACLGSA_03180 [Acidobacteriota bacterium]